MASYYMLLVSQEKIKKSNRTYAVGFSFPWQGEGTTFDVRSLLVDILPNLSGPRRHVNGGNQNQGLSGRYSRGVPFDARSVLDLDVERNNNGVLEQL